MPLETGLLIAYCFGLILNVLIATGVLGNPKHEFITIGDVLGWAVVILLSWVGTGAVILGTLLSNVGYVLHNKRQHRPKSINGTRKL